MINVGIPAHTALEQLAPFIVLYIGPDQMLPLTSALGAIVGVLLIFWQRVVVWARKGWQFCMRKLHRSATQP